MTLLCVNVKRLAEAPPVVIRAHRGASPLGNPFRIGADGTREQVITKYRRWLWQKIAAGDAAVLASLDEIAEAEARHGAVAVGCFCAPAPCHVDVAIAAVRWRQARTPHLAETNA